MTEKEALALMEKQRQEDIEKDLPAWILGGTILLIVLRFLFRHR